MSAKFRRKFQSAVVGVDGYGDGSARWTLTFDNGSKRLSFRRFQSEEQAFQAATEHYLPLCQKKIDAGERIWVVYNVISPKDGKQRPVFTDASVE
jgi:hypothetical protein|tara:strand:+ start:1281 stop:1565 length:285 start_codon:yes stop_codon:yes gene_type:complete